jgi:RNA polymerase sigma-70 factor (ECF subfamily)
LHAPASPSASGRSLDDAALARSIAGAGESLDPGAEAELCRRFGPRVRLYGLRHLREPQAAADLAQQVLLMTLERLRSGKLREPEKLASYVFGICRMVVLELRRGTARRDALLGAYGDAEEAVASAAEPLDRAKLAGCLHALEERERSVLVLSFFADKAAGEVAAELGLTAGNVRVIRHRALLRLRGCMDAPGAAA